MKEKKPLTIAAILISRVFDAYNVALIICLMLFLLSYAAYPTAIVWTIFFVCILVILPLLGDWYIVSTHKVSDWDLSMRKERVRYVYLDALTMLMLFLVTIALHAPPIFVATATILFVLELAYALITSFWKISVHAQVVGLLCAYILVFIGPLYAWCTFFIPIIFFARLYLRKHTFGQLVTGLIITMTTCFVILKLFNFY